MKNATRFAAWCTWAAAMVCAFHAHATPLEANEVLQGPVETAAVPGARAPKRAVLPEQAARGAVEALGAYSPDAASGNDSAAQTPLKTLDNGLYFEGNFTFQRSGPNVSMTVAKINNDSSTRTTGTLRLELWATSSRPARAAGFNGYRLATGANLSPLPPRTFYSDVTRSTTFSEPPSGTYWMVLVLSEFDSVNCPAADHFCIQDTGIFPNQQAFGTVSTGLVTILSREADQCYENFPADALGTLQQIIPGLFETYPSTTSCASLGLGFFAGVLVVDGNVRVYTSNASSAQILCNTGLISGCTTTPSSGASFTDLWWNPSESGWGVSITHHPSGVIFVAWYTYDTNGNPKWYVASECRLAGSTCTGTLYETTGPRMGTPFNPALVSVRAVGSVTLRFSGPDAGSMSYSVNGITGTKSIVRQPF
jgi:hypothetical protein